MNKVERFEGEAPKIKGDGSIRYHLWTDDQGALFVQLSANEVDTASPGTLDQYLFPVAEYIDRRCEESQLNVTQGLRVETESPERVENNNTSAFLKAVLRHLFPCSMKA
ncbi:hypothetical protein [Salinivibrio sp. ES.052]|uniref:hypothetical protein n=1 Tax=Salinivibrio sp. ES.052 TaxID=1882823 RepID=UPI00092886AF|nr:hypothetical protein [Salinivibrio sp. ES.052]SIO06886.1 hypothetical protein SAMN05444724_1912 [Salinivibrio sp. ES.052]SIO40843.1 hypothetical protein SAMN05444724_3241 [Salinivibrio sp. ES.052]